MTFQSKIHSDPVKDSQSTEKELASLINLTGKLRMLSHQFVMCSLLHDQATEVVKFADLQTNALKEFEKIAQQITDPSVKNGLSQETVDVMITRKVVDPEQAERLQYFVTQAHSLRHNRDKAKAAELGAFAATTLLNTLNALIGNIGRALDYRIMDKQKDQAPLLMAANSSLDEITRLSKTLQIVAMNASLEAQRAGNEGAAFGEIAREMRTLSDKGTEQAAKLEQDLDDFKKAHVTATGRPV